MIIEICCQIVEQSERTEGIEQLHQSSLPDADAEELKAGCDGCDHGEMPCKKGGRRVPFQQTPVMTSFNPLPGNAQSPSFVPPRRGGDFQLKYAHHQCRKYNEKSDSNPTDTHS